jgi:N-acetyl-alpha-D-glucosaminyl L-malate synthase BshA
LFREPQYLLSLANKIVHVARHEQLDVVHAHYAVPHATAAYLARQILAAGQGPVPAIITTLHGTDITLLGSDRSYSETVAFCIEQSDGVTAVSESLKADTCRELSIRTDIRVIPNFLNCTAHQRIDASRVRARLIGEDDAKVAIHVSNFRPVKRVTAVVEIFDRIVREVRTHLLMVGDGPDFDAAARLANERGLDGRVHFLGEQDQVLPLLSIADVFLLPSAQESFGLAALEAMASGVPVVATNVGGLPEVIDHGRNGFLHPLSDLQGMAGSAVALLTDPDLHRRVASAAVEKVRSNFCEEKIVPLYEGFYQQVLAAGAGRLA